MNPPWREYRSIPAGEIHWRMGSGEDYLSRLHDWLDALSPDERKAWVRAQHPIPEDWQLWAAEVFALPEIDETSVDQAFGELFPQR